MIESAMRRGKSAKEAVNEVASRFKFNDHDLNLLAKHASGIKL